MLVVTDQNYLPTLLKLLDEAKKSIDLLSYSFAIGSAAGKLTPSSAPYEIALKLKELKQKHGRKLRIRYFSEGLRDTVERNRVTAEFLEAAGVEVVFGSTHAKGFCIDGRLVLFGSTNLTNQSIRKNYEANILSSDPVVARQFLRYFNHLWKGGEHGGIKLKEPLLADGAFEPVLIRMLDQARKRIDFSIYFFNHRGIEAALIRAHERGVLVRGFIHRHFSFALSYIRANQQTVKRLKAAGLDNLHWGPAHLFSHAKYLVVDGKEVMLGTGNWLMEDVHTHPQLTIHLKDLKVARALLRHLTQEIEDQGA